VIFLVLLIGGFFRSLTFTAVNSNSYADVEPKRMSQATSFAAVAQQLSLSIGVGLAALLLTLARGAGAALQPSDFVLPFLVITGIVLGATLQFASLSPEAGNELANRGLGAVGVKPAEAKDSGRPAG
jgi:hypothetical protein